jgi:hypothetical protein
MRQLRRGGSPPRPSGVPVACASPEEGSDAPYPSRAPGWARPARAPSRAKEETDFARLLSPGAKLHTFFDRLARKDGSMKLQRSYVVARVVVGSTLAAGMLVFPGPSSGQVAGPVKESTQQPKDSVTPPQGAAGGRHAAPPVARGTEQSTEGRRPEARRGGSQGDGRGDRSERPGGPSALDHNPGDWLVQLLGDRFDLRLVSWGNGSRVPTSGKKLVIVGVDNNDQLHIRIFDAGGKRVMDTNETKLSSAQAVAILTLKRELAGLSPPHELTGAKQARVMRKVRSIVGRASLADQRRLSQAQPGQLPRRSRTTGSRSRRDAGSSPSPGLSTGRDGGP